MYHPDLTNGHTVEKFQKISNAYSVIGHAETKARIGKRYLERKNRGKRPLLRLRQTGAD